MSISDLSQHLAGKVGLPGDAVYDQGRTVWYPAARERMPLATIQPAGTKDVAAAIRWARRENIRLSPRSGGHSFDGFPVQPETVLLDFSQMNGRHLQSDGVLRAEPGARASALAEALSPHERALPTGDCATVAMGGLLSGGGFGYASRALGLTIDSVVGATLVTGEGEILEVDADRNADLFWACRGGGGAAAIATEFKIRSFSVSEVTAIQLSFDWESAAEAMLAYDAILGTAPRGLDLKFKLRSTGAERFLDTSSAGPEGCVPGIPIVDISGQFLGRRDQAEPLLVPLLDLPGLKESSLCEEGYFDAMLDLIPLPSLNDPAPATLRPMRVASDFVRGRLDRAAARAITDFVDKAQNSAELWGGCVLIEPCDGAVHETGASATAFYHRDSRLLLEWELVQPFEETDQDRAILDRFLTDKRREIAPILTGGRYLNYADRLDDPETWWGGNLERLSALAERYDPDRCIVSRLRPVG